MNRRSTLKWLGAVALGVSLPATVSQSTELVSLAVIAPDEPDHLPLQTESVVCRVIGVGDAGRNILLAAWSSGLLQAKHCRAEFACVNMGRKSTRAVSKANRLNPGITPVKSVQLARFGAGSNVKVARTAARKHDKALRSLMDGADVVILVAGLGGGTGSGVSPILAGMAREAGALAFAVVVTPFSWELGRYPNAFQAVKELERECDYLASLSNQTVGEELGEDATLDDVVTQQKLMGAACIRRLMVDGSRFCIDRRSRPT
ncbi:hypothetical protein [Rhodoferax sp.]|uniref:hypothetical protein n=1 Tax=Rhodoferax sp. TaxID=50421 RepID=UPI002749A621|nr:hypothetical protein [Rhodoferax sp.]